MNNGNPELKVEEDACTFLQKNYFICVNLSLTTNKMSRDKCWAVSCLLHTCSSAFFAEPSELSIKRFINYNVKERKSFTKQCSLIMITDTDNDHLNI